MSDKETTDTAPAAPQGATETVTLGTPIKRGETEIAVLTLRKPVTGDLRGLKLNDVLQSDVDSLIRLVPRIALEPIVDADVAAMPVDDIAEIGGTVFGFFMNAQQRAAVERMMS